LPRHLGQTPKMVCPLATVRDVDHTCRTARPGQPFLSPLRGLQAAPPT
jgi:hypothetical protein